MMNNFLDALNTALEKFAYIFAFIGILAIAAVYSYFLPAVFLPLDFIFLCTLGICCMKKRKEIKEYEEEVRDEQESMAKEEEKKKDEFRAYIVENLSLRKKLESFCKLYEVNDWHVPEIPLNKFGHLFCNENENEKFILQNDVQKKFVVFNDDFYKEYDFDDVDKEDANGELFWTCPGEIKLLRSAVGNIYAIAGDKELVIKFIKYLNKNF